MIQKRNKSAPKHISLVGIPGLYLHDQQQSGDMGRLLARQYAIASVKHVLGENILAEQFIQLDSDAIFKLSLESGEFEPVCANLEYLRNVLTGSDDANYFLAGSLKLDWEKASGRTLLATERLVPTTPFVGGGAFAASNLHTSLREKAVDYLVDFHAQTKDLPDGSTVQLKVVP